MQLVDTHVHLNFKAFEPDFEAVVQRWRASGISRLVHSCVEPSEFESIQAIAHRYPEIFFAVGLHPLDAEQWISEMEQRIQSLAASDAKVVAIGETGLDFYKADNFAQQSEAFLAHLRIARALALPVIIHCRDAAESMAQLLQQFWGQHGSVSGVMHCWGGTPEQTQWFLDLGFYISFSGTVTFKNAVQIHESAQMVPPERLLIETDCPFLAPVPKRGDRRNEPANVYHVAQRVAELRETALEALAEQTTKNACRLFKLPRTGDHLTPINA
jgi:TatD DNase family protein